MTSANNVALRVLMDERQLTRADVARLLSMPIRRYSSGTVDAWLSGRRNMPAAKLELLRLKVAAASLPA